MSRRDRMLRAALVCLLLAGMAALLAHPEVAARAWALLDGAGR